MQSSNYVCGSTGWKLHKNGSLEFNSSGDPCLISAQGLKKEAEEENKRAIGDSLISKFGIKIIALPDGRYVAAGIGLGRPCEGGHTGCPDEQAAKAEVKIDCTVDASKALDQISKLISTTGLAQSIESLKVRIEHEASSRVCADDTLSCRISAVEAGLNSLRAKQ